MTSTHSPSVASGRGAGIRICSAIHRRTPVPSPSTTRPGAMPASVAVSIAISAGWRVNGLTTAVPMAMRAVTAAAAPASAKAPVWK